MGREYKIVLSIAAEEDLELIFRYISEELVAAQAAYDVLKKIERYIYRLGEFPYSSPSVPILSSLKKKYYKLVVDNYIVLYIIDDTNKVVEIVRIANELRSYKDLL